MVFQLVEGFVFFVVVRAQPSNPVMLLPTMIGLLAEAGV